MKRLFVDMDGVLCDYNKGKIDHCINEHDSVNNIPNFFRKLKPLKDSVNSLNKIIHSKKYDVYILSTAPWSDPSSWTDKRLWLEDYFDQKLNKRLILSHRKDFLKGDLLIDDRPNNGAKEFEGEWIHFGSDRFPEWETILNYLL